jgi:hypothetical protein
MLSPTFPTFPTLLILMVAETSVVVDMTAGRPTALMKFVPNQRFHFAAMDCLGRHCWHRRHHWQLYWPAKFARELSPARRSNTLSPRTRPAATIRAQRDCGAFARPKRELQRAQSSRHFAAHVVRSAE